MKVTSITPFEVQIEDIIEGSLTQVLPGHVVGSKLVENNAYELYYQKTNIEGLYLYGCKQLYDGWDHKAGYIWSSRASCINKNFDTMLIPVRFNGTYCAMDANILKPLVELYYNNRCEIKVKENSRCDLWYVIEEVEE